MHWLYKFCFAFVLLLGVVSTPEYGFAQDKIKQLENQRVQLEKSIEYTEVLLEDTRESKHASLDELALLNDQINNRQKLIDNYAEERDSRQDTIFQLLFKLDELALEVEALKGEYARMIYFAFKNQNTYQRMFYVLASSDFNQAIRRVNYFKLYASKRKDQVQLIKKSEEKYLLKVEAFELSIDNTEKLLAKLEGEKDLLEKEKQRKDLAVETLAKQEKKLNGYQADRRKKASDLRQQIEIIATENLNVPTTSNSPSTEALILMTPEDEVVSINFSLNQGHLPWPLEKGVVSSSYGEHNHPDLQGIKVRNNGINIMTHQGSKARAIFNGEVTRVMSMPNFNNVVIIRHGNFLSVYTNLDEVFVEPGKSVTTKEEIGSVFTDELHYKTELHFEIWEGKTLLDPEKWLASDKSSSLLN